MATDYDAIYDKLRQYAEDVHLCLSLGFTYGRLVRIRDNVAWSESIDGEEIQFEALVDEKCEESVLLAVCAVQSVVDGKYRGIEGPSFTYDGVVERNQAR